jgi:hypothetical protein
MKMKMKITLHAQPSKYEEGGFYYTVNTHEDMTSVGYMALDSVEVEFNVPPHEVMVNGAIAIYRAEQAKLRADAQEKVNGLEEEIQKLLCLENKA